MQLEVTPEAIEVLKRSLELGSLDPATHGIRLRVATTLAGHLEVQVELAAEATTGEEEIEAGGIRLFVDPEVADVYPDPVVDVEPQHETVVVRSAR